MSFGAKHNDSEDMFADTRMSFGEHLEELRVHLWRAIAGFGVALVVSFFIGKPVLQFIAAPVEVQLEKFYADRVRKVHDELETRCKITADSLSELRTAGVPEEVLAKLKALKNKELDNKSFVKELARVLPPDDLARYQDLVLDRAKVQADPRYTKLNTPIEIELSVKRKEAARLLLPPGQAEEVATSEGPEWVSVPARIKPLDLVINLHPSMQAVGRRPALSTLSVQEAFMAYFKVCLACGLVLGSPWIFYQIWLFVAAGLYPQEKRLVNVYLPFSLSLFLAGVLVCQFLVIPKAIEALLWFNQWIGLEPDLRFNEWLGFAIMMPLVFGLSFQLPLVMMFLERIGVVTIDTYKSKWRIALFLIEVFAAIITPSVDIVSMQLLAVPMFGLYALGIYLCSMNPQRRELDVDVPDSEEMVEV